MYALTDGISQINYRLGKYCDTINSPIANLVVVPLNDLKIEASPALCGHCKDVQQITAVITVNKDL